MKKQTPPPGAIRDSNYAIIKISLLFLGCLSLLTVIGLTLLQVFK